MMRDDAKAAKLGGTIARNGIAGILVLGLLTLSGAIIGPSLPAIAETLSISATALVLRCPCSTQDFAQEDNGVFVGETPNGRYFVQVVFPVTTGQKVCSFTMIYEDTNATDTLIARLMRKGYKIGGDPFAAPTVIAKVESASGTPATVRQATTTAITSPTISATNAFYYIEADVATFNLNILGFLIGYKPTSESCT